MREFYFGAFRSRSQCMRFFELVKGRGFRASVINTPREASIGCGISVQVEAQDFYAVRGHLDRIEFNSFAGWFRVTVDGRRYNIERV